MPATVAAKSPRRCGGYVATITGNANKNNIEGTAGDDVIYAGASRDQVWGGGGNDIICGAKGSDYLQGDRLPDQTPGHDTIYGGDGNDSMDGGDESDEFYPGKGDDWFTGGGSTQDYLLYSKVGKPVQVRMDLGIATAQGTDVFEEIEIVRGTKYADYLTGSAGCAGVSGSQGADLIFAGGCTYAYGDDGNDEIHGTDGSDILYGDAGEDWLYGKAGDDDLEAEDSELDHVFAGDGTDTCFTDDIDETQDCELGRYRN
ncbi:MAG: hypothetical protein ABR529_06690 [Actinomycetota bacterium]